MHRAQRRADWKVSLPKTPSEAKMLMIKNPASLITKQIGGNGNITQSLILEHCCRSYFSLLVNICTNKQNSNNHH
jgi:hypothetical protein